MIDSGTEVSKVLVSDNSGGVSRLVSRVDVMHEKLGVVPEVDLKEGLRRTVALDAQFGGLYSRAYVQAQGK